MREDGCCGVIAFDFVFTLLALIAARALARTIFERPRPGFLLPTGREVLVIGAGEAGQLVVREMLKKRALGYSPTRLLDDDPRKQGMRLEGVRVEGKTTDLDEILESSPPDEVVIAMPGAEPGVRQRIVDVCRRRGVPVKTVPGVNELLDGDLDLLERLRAVQVEDVLGRAPVQLDLAAIGGYLTGRTVLVTGAGGSIGSELCRQIGRLSPHRLVLAWMLAKSPVVIPIPGARRIESVVDSAQADAIRLTPDDVKAIEASFAG